MIAISSFITCYLSSSAFLFTCPLFSFYFPSVGFCTPDTSSYRGYIFPFSLTMVRLLVISVFSRFEFLIVKLLVTCVVSFYFFLLRIIFFVFTLCFVDWDLIFLYGFISFDLNPLLTFICANCWGAFSFWLRTFSF